MFVKALPLYCLCVMAAFTIGLLQEIARGVLGGQDVSAEAAATVVAAPCTVLFYFGFRWSGVSLHLGHVLSSYLASIVTVASTVIAFALPPLIFNHASLTDFIIAILVAAVIAAIAAAGLAKFYRGSSPESPDDLD